MRWFLLLSVAFLVLLLSACSPGGSPAPVGQIPQVQPTGISVVGEGKVLYTPDIALIVLGIEAEAKSVAEAQRQAKEGMDRVISALKGKKIPEKDIQTIHFSITPVRQWIEEFPRNGKEVIIGYRVSNILRVKVREIAKAGEIIDAAVIAGGDLIRVQSISFTIDDPIPLYRLAREKAIMDAKAKAEQLARFLGVEVGKPTFISEEVPFIPFPEVHLKVLPIPAPVPPSPPTPILPGEMELRLTVYVVFAIK